MEVVSSFFEVFIVDVWAIFHCSNLVQFSAYFVQRNVPILNKWSYIQIEKCIACSRVIVSIRVMNIQILYNTDAKSNTHGRSIKSIVGLFLKKGRVLGDQWAVI